jgi:lipoprotein-anchoring transpeptidase ErfK/SrfK
MDDQFIESRKAVAKAREAMRFGDHDEARIWAEQAAKLAPTTEDPWLILAAIAAPSDSLVYLQKALAINPDSQRARKGLHWVKERLSAAAPVTEQPSWTLKQTAEASGGPINANPSRSPARRARPRRAPWLPALVFVLGFLLVACAAGAMSASPALASMLGLGEGQQSGSAAHPQSWAHAEIAKPTYTLMPVSLDQQEAPTVTPTVTLPVLAVLAADTPIPPVAAAPSIIQENNNQNDEQNDVVDPGLLGPIDIPDLAPVIQDPVIVDNGPTATPGTLYAEIVADTPTSEYIAPTAAAFEPGTVPSGGYGDRWIDVDLSQQRVYAYEGDTVVNSFVVSTGTWQTPTVTGRYKVWIKLRSTTMAGPGYYLTNVPYVMYFHKGYGLHGTYWHNNFGTPMSHGCVNLTIPDAEWIYNFSVVGTVVNVHY